MATQPANLPEEAPILAPGHTLDSINNQISSIVLRPGILRGWLLGFGIAFLVVMLFLYAVANLLVRARR